MSADLRFLSLAMVLAATLAGCGRPPELIGVEHPEVPVASVEDLTRHRIFITTTREASEVVGAFYSSGRAPELGLASVDVTVPPTHVVGQTERPRRLPPDPRTEFAVVDPVVYQSDASFIAAIDRELATRPPGQRGLLLFVHGYNNTTSDAILRLTQFVEDAGYEGLPVLFTWASAARAPRYVYDLNSALVARVKLKEMSEILSRTQAERLDLFAHSMGVVPDDGGAGGRRAGRPPDRRAHRPHHAGLARHRHRPVPHPDRSPVAADPRQDVPPRVADDRALRVSRRIAGGVPRVGAADAAELERLGVTVIDLSEIHNSSSGSHSKFAGSPEVVQLIGAGLNSVGNFGAAPPASTSS